MELDPRIGRRDVQQLNWKIKTCKHLESPKLLYSTDPHQLTFYLIYILTFKFYLPYFIF
jgi:hypothetical protein